jgi:hypothetical protein
MRELPKNPLACWAREHRLLRHVGFEVITAVVLKSTIFWDRTPCSPLKVNQQFGGTYHLHLQGREVSQGRNQREAASSSVICFTLVSCLAYILTLNMEVICSSKKSFDFQRTTRRYIPGDITTQVYTH